MSGKKTKRYCKIINCENQLGTSDKNVLFFILPTFNESSREKWINKIKNHQQIDDGAARFYVCELHFDSGVINREKKRDQLDKNGVPTIFPDRPSQEENFSALEVSKASTSSGLLGESAASPTQPESAASPTQLDIHLTIATDQIRKLQQDVEELKTSRRSMQKRISHLEAALRKARELSAQNNTEYADKQVA